MKQNLVNKNSGKLLTTAASHNSSHQNQRTNFSLVDNRVTAVVQQKLFDKIQSHPTHSIQLKQKGLRARIRKKLAGNVPLTDREKVKAISYGILQDHEHTHRNVPNATPARRGSIAGANLLDTISPSASIPHTGLNLADFRARFQPLVRGGNISTARLNALLPKHKAVAFPPARGGGADEIRAGRKWEIPNPEGGTHSIWVHTNDPRQNPPENAAAGPIARVQDSSGKFLSEQYQTAPKHLLDQQAKRAKKKKAPIPDVERAIANKTGHWTTPDDDRANDQHIPLT
ncbi:hypothetical protein [uncultured Kordia sp.]|uniref:hypothetical protein n=1 Tax=uncultured Kordia sp. TaxID=507699 RepID=UPI002638CD68|nr:hypothetical protein [uncultured Kordia sp.]